MSIEIIVSITAGLFIKQVNQTIAMVLWSENTVIIIIAKMLHCLDDKGRRDVLTRS